jgi:hypothetical protein
MAEGQMSCDARARMFVRLVQDNPLEQAWTASQIMDDGRWGVISQDNSIMVGLSANLQEADVRNGLSFFREKLIDAANMHDFDKLTDIAGFHRDFVTGFKQTEWWDNHRKVNRHHLLQADGVPIDVNLIDVLDMIADCVMAGMARSGSVYDLNIDPEVLMKAFRNTVDMLKTEVEVKT